MAISPIKAVLHLGEGALLKKLGRQVAKINALEASMRDMSDEALRNQTLLFKDRLAQGESLDSLLVEAFATVREASHRVLGMRHFDVQLMGGAALHLGNIAEMKTGEGKTLVATLPAYLNALTGKGVHVVTTNDFLAHYQSDLMGRVFRFLGMTTGCLLAGMSPEERRAQYAADITYGTNNEFGFDYLRDNLATSIEDRVQREHTFAIVDEADSILIDEARTPLIISGPVAGDTLDWYNRFTQIVSDFVAGFHYEVDEKKRTVSVLSAGIDAVEEALNIDNLYNPENTFLIAFMQNALKAKALFKRDQDYVVVDDQVFIVDEHTGRVMKGRKFNDGLHQALESKEGVTVNVESQTYASISLQNYFRMYEKLSGMTGTAETEAAELAGIYGLGVVPIPTNKPMRRTDHPDVIYRNEVVKYGKVLEDIEARHRTGQPVLVGTASVDKSEFISKMLTKRGIAHEVLNAKNPEREAHIVAQAGRLGAVTVATNMAGRGTDIILGGNAEYLTVEELARQGLEPASVEYQEAWTATFASMKAAVAAEAEKVVSVGGLYVLGTERHESRRIDNQLRGRAGRQGDKGESRFYLSLTDDLVRVFGNSAVGKVLAATAVNDDSPVEMKVVSRAVQSAQTQVEGLNAEMRKNMLKFDDVINQQRERIYADREALLHGADISERVLSFIDTTVRAITKTHMPHKNAVTEENAAALISDLSTVYPVSLTVEEIVEHYGGWNHVSPEDFATELIGDARVAYAQRGETLGSELMRRIERQIVLAVVDRKWRDHLYEIDYLKEGIALRAYAQRNPIVEFTREASDMFNQMVSAIKEESVRAVFNAEVFSPEAPSNEVPVPAEA